MAKTYHSLKDHLRSRFETEVRRLPLSTGRICPHRSKTGGCVYCNEASYTRQADGDIRSQLHRGIASARAKGFRGRFIAYFQTGTNTWGDVDSLSAGWQCVLDFPETIVGLSISTRPDYLEKTHLERLQTFVHAGLLVWVELGLQSANDETLKRIRRGHDFATFKRAVALIRAFPGIEVIGHIILGLPGETLLDMRHTIGEVNRLGLDGLKIHHLQVVKTTVLESWYTEGKVSVYDEATYLSVLQDLIPRIDSRIVLHRLVGEVHPEYLIAPRWTMPKTRLLPLLEERLEREGLRQGDWAETQKKIQPITP